MKKIRVAFPDLQNAGDIFNVVLLDKLFGIEIIRSKVYNADLTAIGGALSGVQYSKEFTRSKMQHMLGKLYSNRTLYVWGSGFLYGDNENSFYRRKISICALRGKLSRSKVSEIMKIDVNVPLADPGLLASKLLSERRQKKYSVGIIPHFSQQQEEIFAKLNRHYQNSTIIDITKPPLEVIDNIASCEYIISSSLHGLVFADSLLIPSLPVVGETPLAGGDFKFCDYYSSFDIEYRPWDIHKTIPSINDIIDQYKIKREDVYLKQKQLVESFPASLMKGEH